MTNDLPDTLIEAVRYFADREVCEAYMRQIKWPDGVITCPHCGASGERIGEIASRHLLRCKDCRKSFSHKVGTIFEDSPLPLGHWFVAVWCIANDKNGISSYELHRALGVSQKTAWFLLHRVRNAMEVADSGEKFDGPTEADTTYIGGRAANMHKARRERTIKGRGAVGKTAVHGVLQRTTEAGPSQVRAAGLLGGNSARSMMLVSWGCNKGEPMAKEAKKPEGWKAFDAMAKRVAAVPKEEVDAKIAKDKAARIKARRKK